MKTVALYTLGCKVNQYDTQVMTELLVNSGYRIVPFDSLADIYIINTCTVTNIADRKSRQIISRAHKKNADAIICVCGCLSQCSPEEVLGIDGVTCVAGTGDRSDIVQILEKAQSKKNNFVKAIENVFENTHISNSGIKTRANIKIQEGCENYCSYCIIPYVRGKERSRDLGSILAEIDVVSNAGCKEVVLGGIHVSSYNDHGLDLADVVERINGIEAVKRIRLGSLEQPALTESFIRRLSGNQKLCPHFHISLQSGDNSVLKRMNRKYTAEDYLRTVECLRTYFEDPAITTDIIVGFPGESDEEFNSTLQFVKRVGFARIHVFPFSVRKGTAAEKMSGKVDAETKKKRAASLIDLGKQLERTYVNKWVGREAEVLFEQIEPSGYTSGYTERYIKVTGKADPGDIKKVLLKECIDDIIITV